jgi:hypothetical protein
MHVHISDTLICNNYVILVLRVLFFMSSVFTLVYIQPVIQLLTYALQRVLAY